MEMLRITIDRDLCAMCGTCTLSCPETVFVQKGKNLFLISSTKTFAILFSAPCVLFFHADKSINFSDVNSSLAVQNAMLLCHSLGLGCFYAGYVVSACKRDNRIHHLLSIPNNHQVYGALAIGYPKFEYKKWIERRPAWIDWK
jgi:nitroreductase